MGREWCTHCISTLHHLLYIVSRSQTTILSKFCPSKIRLLGGQSLNKLAVRLCQTTFCLHLIITSLHQSIHLPQPKGFHRSFSPEGCLIFVGVTSGSVSEGGSKLRYTLTCLHGGGPAGEHRTNVQHIHTHMHTQHTHTNTHTYWSTYLLRESHPHCLAAEALDSTTHTGRCNTCMCVPMCFSIPTHLSTQAHTSGCKGSVVALYPAPRRQSTSL